MAESLNFMQPAIHKFRRFYDHWAMLMENLLRSMEHWGLIKNGVMVCFSWMKIVLTSLLSLIQKLS